MTYAAFRRCMAERRQHPRNSAEWRYLTRAARECLWSAMGVSALEMPTYRAIYHHMESKT